MSSKSGPARTSKLCGRADVTRVSILEPAFAAVHESAVGTKRNYLQTQGISGAEGIPGVPSTGDNGRPLTRS